MKQSDIYVCVYVYVFLSCRAVYIFIYFILYFILVDAQKPVKGERGTVFASAVQRLNNFSPNSTFLFLFF